jgi:hypothetical protein
MLHGRSMRPTPSRLKFAHRFLSAFCAFASILLLIGPSGRLNGASPSIETLRQNFAHPPIDARPMVRWWWFGPAVVKPEILRELQQMKADGIQGAELAFVYPLVLDDAAKGLKNLPFLSPEMLDAVTYAETQGRQLGLRIDVTLCSGWPYGGPHISLRQAATRLRTVEIPVPPGATSVTVPTLAEGKSVTALIRGGFMVGGLPRLAMGDSILSAALAVSGPPRAPLQRGRRGAAAAPPNWDPASARPLAISGTRITVAPSDQPRVALFFVQSHTGQQVKRAAVDANGYVLDPFAREAIDTHLEKVGEPLVKAFGDTPPYAIFSDSLEAFGADWTPRLPEEFKRRRGYDLIAHLPELVAGGTPAADTIRHDYGKTLTELVNENYLQPITDWASAHRTKFRSQTYNESAVSFSSQNIAQLAEGEGPHWRSFSTLRWATSANHVFGHAVSSGETFTWLHSPVFRATPLDMKAEADIDFVMGENLIICHGWPYSAPPGQVPEPGWSLYAAGAFNDHNPWHPVMPAVTAYLGRLSYLLRQGDPANQVAILVPTDDAWARFHPTQTSITGQMPSLITPALMSAVLSAGYNVDYIDAEAVATVGLAKYPVVVLPPTDRIPVKTLQQIAAYVAAGGKVVAVGRAPSLDPEGRTVPELTALSKQLFVPAQSSFVQDEATLGEALNQQVKPDFELPAGDGIAKSQLGFIRRRLSAGDVYFVANTSNQPIATTASFATTHPSGEAWDPDSAEVSPVQAQGLTVKLAPYESRVFVFYRSEPASSSVEDSGVAAAAARASVVSGDWRVRFLGLQKVTTQAALTDWISDPSTLHYSGEAIYSHEFGLPGDLSQRVFLEVRGGAPLPGAPNAPEDLGRPQETLGADGLPNPLITRTGPGMHAYYAPPIREAALVTINGQPAGALWHPPYRLDVTKFVHSGANLIEIHVFNTALNAWSALPPHDFGPLIAEYGDRFQMQDLDRVAPISSGLLGEVRLVVSPGRGHPQM